MTTVGVSVVRDDIDNTVAVAITEDGTTPLAFIVLPADRNITVAMRLSTDFIARHASSIVEFLDRANHINRLYFCCPSSPLQIDYQQQAFVDHVAAVCQRMQQQQPVVLELWFIDGVTDAVICSFLYSIRHARSMQRLQRIVFEDCVTDFGVIAPALCDGFPCLYEISAPTDSSSVCSPWAYQCPVGIPAPDINPPVCPLYICRLPGTQYVCRPVPRQATAL